MTMTFKELLVNMCDGDVEKAEDVMIFACPNILKIKASEQLTCPEATSVYRSCETCWNQEVGEMDMD